MRRQIVTIFAVTLATFSQTGFSQKPAERVSEIQAALKEAKLDGWLFYDFRGTDPLAYRILKLDPLQTGSRRWFYYIPPAGEPVKIVHAIERGKLDALPGKKIVYLAWQELEEKLRETLVPKSGRDASLAGRPQQRVAMQYSPENSIPYMSRVDAGTMELIRSFQVEPVSSAELVQRFEAVWTEAQRQMHVEAADKIHRIIMEAFDEIARCIRAKETTTEYDIQQFFERRFAEEELTDEGHAPIVAVNANAADPHYGPTPERSSPIKRGHFVQFDVWAKLKKPEAVYADQSWVGYVGESVPKEYTRIFNIVRDARDAAVAFVQENLRLGKVIKGAEVDDVSRGVIKRAGYAAQFLHRTGHSIGEEVHGNGVNIDNLETNDTRPIIPRTCFSIEPGIYLEDKFGVRSEINVYIVNEKEAEVTGQPVQMEIVAILKEK